MKKIRTIDGIEGEMVKKKNQCGLVKNVLSWVCGKLGAVWIMSEYI